MTEKRDDSIGQSNDDASDVDLEDVARKLEETKRRIREFEERALRKLRKKKDPGSGSGESYVSNLDALMPSNSIL